MPNFTGYIYKFTSKISGKSYIGKTFHLGSRLNNHIQGRGNTSLFQEALNNDGITSFTFEILYCISNDDLEKLNKSLYKLEQDSIQSFDTFNNGYNKTLGGAGYLGYSPSDEMKEIISSKLKGHSPSQESRRKMSESHKGFKHSEESISKMRESFKNRSQEKEDYRKQKLRQYLQSLTDEDIRRRAEKCKKPVLQYSTSGELIKEWKSATDVASFFNINKVNITKCCSGVQKTSIGYIWKYKED